MKHGNLLRAGRSKILAQQRNTLLVEFAAPARQYFRNIPFCLDRGIDPIDREARHRAINDEGYVSCRIGRAEVDGMTSLRESHGDRGGNRRLSDAPLAHDHD